MVGKKINKMMISTTFLHNSSTEQVHCFSSFVNKSKFGQKIS